MLSLIFAPMSRRRRLMLPLVTLRDISALFRYAFRFSPRAYRALLLRRCRDAAGTTAMLYC